LLLTASRQLKINKEGSKLMGEAYLTRPKSSTNVQHLPNAQSGAQSKRVFGDAAGDALSVTRFILF
jgi:hypothetical protein